MTTLQGSVIDILGIRKTVTVSGSTTLVGTTSTIIIGTVTVTGSTAIIGTVTVTGSTAIIGTVTVTGSTTSVAPTLTKGTQGSTGFSVQDLKDAGRTNKRFYATAHAAAATTIEQLLTLSHSSQDSSVVTGTTFTITNGKIFRISGMFVSTRGNSVATAQLTTFSLRLNTAGAVTTASTVLLAVNSATPAVASDYDRMPIPIDDGIEITGDGTKQWGISSNSVYTVNAPTLDVAIIGFEY